MVRICGLGHGIPARRVTSAELGGLFGLDAGWILQRTGIGERRLLSPGESGGDLAVAAAEAACKDAGIAPHELGALIVSTVTHELRTPAFAVWLAGRIGAGECAAFDVSAASSGFVYALAVARGLLFATPGRPILVVAVETPSRIIDWTDRNTAVLFGDGAGAALLSSAPAGAEALAEAKTPSLELVDVELGSAPAGYEDLKVGLERGSGSVHMDGARVFLAAVRYMGDAASRMLARHGLAAGDIRLVVAHQAGARILDGVSRRTEIPRERFAETSAFLGNTSAASVPIGLSLAKESQLAAAGDPVLLLGFGAGYTWGSALLRW